MTGLGDKKQKWQSPNIGETGHVKMFLCVICRISVKSLRFGVKCSSSDLDVRTFQNQNKGMKDKLLQNINEMIIKSY